MNWYHYFNLLALLIFLASLTYHLLLLIKSGKPLDYAPPAGKVAPSVLYSFTGAMSPKKKESAYLHLPTYTAGILYHLGTFLAILLWILNWFIGFKENIIIYSIAIFLFFTAASGIAVLFKRMIKNELQAISNPDDYLANILVTIFQVLTGLFLLFPSLALPYYLISGLLLLYFPLGKLKHALYFFATRYHLGFFYGWRGVWPPKPIKQ